MAVAAAYTAARAAWARGLRRCCSSVVEHTLGKGEADSSITLTRWSGSASLLGLSSALTQLSRWRWNKRRGTAVIYGMMGIFLIAAIALVVAVIGCALVAPSDQGLVQLKTAIHPPH
jgi:hypothetical protein